MHQNPLRNLLRDLCSNAILILVEILPYLLFILFLAVLGLHCGVQSFSSCCEGGLLFVVVQRLLIAVASPAAESEL